MRVEEFSSEKAKLLGRRDCWRIALLTPEVCRLLGPDEKRIRLRSYHIPTRSAHLNNVSGPHQDNRGVCTLALAMDPDFVLPRSARQLELVPRLRSHGLVEIETVAPVLEVKIWRERSGLPRPRNSEV